MTVLELVCGALALSTALLLVLCYVAMSRSLMWRQRHAELIAKPFSFWVAREHNRLLYEALRGPLSMEKLSAVKTVLEEGDDPDKVVKFRRPASFDTPPL